MTTPTPIDYSKMTKDELYAVLCPPTPELTDKDIRLARARYVMDNFIYDMMSAAEGLRILAAQAGVPGAPPLPAPKEGSEEQNQRRVREALSTVDRFYTKLEKDVDDGDPWNAFAEHFDKYHLDGIYSMHGGDCTAIACTCERCYAEQLFDLPSSASWGGKAAGARVWGAYRRAVEAEKAQVVPTPEK